MGDEKGEGGGVAWKPVDFLSSRKVTSKPAVQVEKMMIRLLRNSVSLLFIKNTVDTTE